MPVPTTLLRTACVLLALLAIRPAWAADIVLRFASVNTEGTAPYEQALVPFVRAIEEESGGRIEVALKPVGGYGKPADLFNMVERGDIEMAATVQGYNPGRFPQSSVMELPFMFPDAVAGTEAMMSLYREGLLSEDYASVKVLALYVLPPYPIFTTGKKIQTMRDFRGLRMRTPSITVGLALAKRCRSAFPSTRSATVSPAAMSTPSPSAGIRPRRPRAPAESSCPTSSASRSTRIWRRLR